MSALRRLPQPSAGLEIAVDALRLVLREELALAPPLRPAPPHDLEAEQTLIACALAGYVAETDPADWYSPSYAAIYVAVAELRAEGATPTDERIAHVLRGCGDSGPLLAQELQTIREATPVTTRLGDLAARIHRRARERAALAHVTRAEALIRTDAPHEDVVEALRAAAGELRRCRE